MADALEQVREDSNNTRMGIEKLAKAPARIEDAHTKKVDRPRKEHFKAFFASKCTAVESLDFFGCRLDDALCRATLGATARKCKYLL